MNTEKLAQHLNENPDEVNSLLSAFSTKDLIDHLELRNQLTEVK